MYRQAFKKSNLIIDSSYTEGYKKTDDIKLPGSRSHFFAKYSADFSDDEYFSDLEINIQKVSNPTYIEVPEGYWTISTTADDFDVDESK